MILRKHSHMVTKEKYQALAVTNGLQCGHTAVVCLVLLYHVVFFINRQNILSINYSILEYFVKLSSHLFTKFSICVIFKIVKIFNF
nr:MAG TPA: hypothetical protein [Caudoviricetes sp.]